MPNIKKATKKLNWSLAIGGGLNYISRNNIFGQDETIKTLNTLSTPVSTGATSNTNTKLSLPKTGFHFSVGVNLDYTISKKLSLQTGIKYRYLENELGLTADTIQVNPTYYYLGNQIKYINYSNQFEIPIAINYCINPLSNTKISLIGGVNLTYIFKDNWLNLYDNISRYQPSVNQNHRFLFGLHTGVSFNFNSKFSFYIIAQKNLSAVQKNSSKYYWQQLDFQINIPFKSLKK